MGPSSTAGPGVPPGWAGAAVSQPGEAGEEEEQRPPQSRSPAPTEQRQRPPGPAMARRAAAVLLLLALGCLLGILLLCLGSGDARGPPSFKVSGGDRAAGRGSRERPESRAAPAGGGAAPRCGALAAVPEPLPRGRSRGRRAGRLPLHCGARRALICENELLFFFFFFFFQALKEVPNQLLAGEVLQFNLLFCHPDLLF